VKHLHNEDFRALIGQLARYALTGGLASIVNIGVYQVGAGQFGIDPNLAWAMGFVAAMLVGYVVHSRWSFRDHGTRDNLARTGGRFLIVSLISFGLNSLWVWLGTLSARAGRYAAGGFHAQQEMGVRVGTR
jgi:putative flippase GtrA